MTTTTQNLEALVDDERRRTPDSLRVGTVDDGWRISMTTLMNERVQMGGKQPNRARA